MEKYPLVGFVLIIGHSVGGEVVRVRHVVGHEFSEAVGAGSGVALLV